MLKRREVVFGTVGAFGAVLSTSTFAEPIGISGFSKFARRQETPVWCWAAVIQTLLNYRGIGWSQGDVVAAMKGNISIATASDSEMSAFLNSWGFNNDGRRWKATSLFVRQAPQPELTVSEFRNQRPIILKLRISPQMDHVVIGYVANVVSVTGKPDQLMQVYYIDPADGQIHLMSAQQYVNDVKAYWLVDIKKA